MIVIRKFAIIALCYALFTFVFLKSAWGKEAEAGESAQLETNLQLKEASPLADYTSFLIQKADEYEIDWKFFPAIAGVESGFCQAYIKSTNNCVGWGGGYKENYIDQGLTSVDLIGSKYAVDPAWSFKVKRHMNEIERTEIL